jgi:hypothetical protein
MIHARFVVASTIAAGLFAISLETLREIACGIERARQALDANDLEQTAQAARKAAILIGIDWLTCRHARFHGLKLTFHSHST